MYIGIDGIKDGWISIIYGDDGYKETDIYRSIKELWKDNDGVDLSLIDIPIGLSSSDEPSRKCDEEARKMLTPRRHQSVFSPPIRDALRADTYKDANNIQRELTGKGISKQSWNITSKIKEVDKFLRDNRDIAGDKLRESHPEVCFYGVTGYPMKNSKTQQPRNAVIERTRALRPLDSEIENAVSQADDEIGDSAEKHDIIDAFVLALTASQPKDKLRTIPDNPPLDKEGLPMEIVYPAIGTHSE